MKYTLSYATMTATNEFYIQSDIGIIRGTAAMEFVISGNTITYNETGNFNSGTATFREILGTDLEFIVSNTLDGQNGVGSITGTALY